MDKSQKTNDNFCCSKCGAHFDLSTNHGRKAAEYGLCGKCGVEEVLNAYKKSNFFAKIIFFIPYLFIKKRYNKIYEKELEIENFIDKISSEEIEPSLPEFDSNMTQFKWNGIVYKIPEKFHKQLADADTMRDIVDEIIKTQNEIMKEIDSIDV